jgi:hypothetical protein
MCYQTDKTEKDAQLCGKCMLLLLCNICMPNKILTVDHQFDRHDKMYISNL